MPPEKINKALSAEHLHIKRKLSRKQQELREQLFLEIKEQLIAFTKSEEYPGWLEDRIKKALKIAGRMRLKSACPWRMRHSCPPFSQHTGITPLLSETSFLGGIRAVIPQKKYFN